MDKARVGRQAMELKQEVPKAESGKGVLTYCWGSSYKAQETSQRSAVQYLAAVQTYPVTEAVRGLDMELLRTPTNFTLVT